MLGLTHIYHGMGKGKTTAAIGLCIRALGHGKKILFVQFMKARESGELSILRSFEGLKILRSKSFDKFSFQMSEQEKQDCRLNNNALLQEVKNIIKEQCPDMLVMDEIIGTYDKNLIDQCAVLELIKKKPEKMELVMTGRNPHAELLELADYVSEIVKVKHPFDQGVPARTGVEQ